MPQLFAREVDWKALAKGNPKQLISEITQILSAYGQNGYYDEDGAQVNPQTNDAERARFMQNFTQELSKHVKESSGAVGASDTPSYFVTAPKYLPSRDYEADMSFLDWMTSVKMDLELEDREEWDFESQFVLMKEAGQVKYGQFSGAERVTRNDEWGAGIHIKWTWFETNQFGIKMNRLAPKFRYNYYNQMSNAIYAMAIATFVNVEAYDTNVIRTINNAFATLIRTTKTWTIGKDHNKDVTETHTRTPFENARFRIIAPIELMWVIQLALTGTFAFGFKDKILAYMSGVTYTTKLTDATKFYIVADKWEQNEFNTRVELTAHGPVDDIETFSQKASYRGAYGATLDADSAKVITLPEDFVIGECNCPPEVIPPA